MQRRTMGVTIQLVLTMVTAIRLEVQVAVPEIYRIQKSRFLYT